MPKVIYGEENRRNDALETYIRHHVGGPNRLKTLADLADTMHMPRQTFYQKMKRPSEKFSHFEVCEIYRLTRATDREVAHVDGVKYAGSTKPALAEAVGCEVI